MDQAGGGFGSSSMPRDGSFRCLMELGLNSLAVCKDVDLLFLRKGLKCFQGREGEVGSSAARGTARMVVEDLKSSQMPNVRRCDDLRSWKLEDVDVDVFAPSSL